MSKWQDSAEAVLTQFQAYNGIPYDYRTFDCDTDSPQLPDSYIVYFLVDDPAGNSFDGKETDHQPRIQVSFYFRNKSLRATIPDKIETAFMEANFMRVRGSDLPYDTDTGHYGWYCDFRFYERR